VPPSEAPLSVTPAPTRDCMKARKTDIRLAERTIGAHAGTTSVCVAAGTVAATVPAGTTDAAAEMEPATLAVEQRRRGALWVCPVAGTALERRLRRAAERLTHSFCDSATGS